MIRGSSMEQKLDHLDREILIHCLDGPVSLGDVPKLVKVSDGLRAFDYPVVVGGHSQVK